MGRFLNTLVTDGVWTSCHIGTGHDYRAGAKACDSSDPSTFKVSLCLKGGMIPTDVNDVEHAVPQTLRYYSTCMKKPLPHEDVRA